MTIGTRIKTLRKEKGLNQTELGNLINLSHGAVAAMESGRNDPSSETTIKLSEIFNVSTDYLLTGKKEPVGISQDEKEVIEIMREDKAFKKAVTEAAGLKKKVISYLVNYKQTEQHTA